MSRGCKCDEVLPEHVRIQWGKNHIVCATWIAYAMVGKDGGSGICAACHLRLSQCLHSFAPSPISIKWTTQCGCINSTAHYQRRRGQWVPVVHVEFFPVGVLALEQMRRDV